MDAHTRKRIEATIHRLELEKAALERRLANLYAMRDVVDVQEVDSA